MNDMNNMNGMNETNETNEKHENNITPQQPAPAAEPGRTKFCKHCGKIIDIDSIICKECGKQVAAVTTKFCKHCGEKIDIDAVICIKCGKQVEELKVSGGGFEQPKIEVNVNQSSENSNANNNSNSNENINTNMIGAGWIGRPKDKWVAFVLCLFLGVWGAHKFYEGRIGTGIFYIFTFGFFGIGILIDLIVLLCKPNPYFVGHFGHVRRF